VRTSVSVVLSVRNVEKYIVDCLASILDQTVDEFELIILDSLSTDKTEEKIRKFSDKRIKYFRSEKFFGLSEGRNNSLKHANGEYIFFTDGDCIVTKNWIEEGLRSLKSPNCIGAEGKTHYVSQNYQPTRSDGVIENKTGGQFMTCNIAYKKVILDKIGGFDERFTYLEDRDLAYRATKFGNIIFNPKMMVYHQKKAMSPKDFIRTGKRLKNRVLLYKKFGEKPLFMGNIAYPLNLASIIFPPLIFGSLLRNRYQSKADFDLFPFTYIQLLYERLSFWEMCAKERVFLM
jgi:GT2 family glycosyltransferase